MEGGDWEQKDKHTLIKLRDILNEARQIEIKLICLHLLIE